MKRSPLVDEFSSEALPIKSQTVRPLEAGIHLSDIPERRMPKLALDGKTRGTTMTGTEKLIPFRVAILFRAGKGPCGYTARGFDGGYIGVTARNLGEVAGVPT